MKPSARPISGESTMNTPIFASPLLDEHAEPGLGHRGARPCRRRGRATSYVGQAEAEVTGSSRSRRSSPAKITPIDQHVLVDDVFGDGRRHMGAEDEERDEVEERRPEPPRSAGSSTRVDTTVAIELAASWKPLTKSNAERDERRR